MEQTVTVDDAIQAIKVRFEGAGDYYLTKGSTGSLTLGECSTEEELMSAIREVLIESGYSFDGWEGWVAGK